MHGPEIGRKRIITPAGNNFGNCPCSNIKNHKAKKIKVIKRNSSLKLHPAVFAALSGLLAVCIVNTAGMPAYFFPPDNAYAADSSYGISRSGSYGEKKEVTTAEEAEKAFAAYFAKKNVRIGEIKEKELYFEAEIRDKNDNLIDKVAVDKRTGRVRSIY